MTTRSKPRSESKKRGLCLAGVCSVLLLLASTGCDVVSAVSSAAGVEKGDQRSRCSILCPPRLR